MAGPPVSVGMPTPSETLRTATPASHVGTCPDCGTPLPRSHVVMVYETGDDPERVAACPACRDLVLA